MAVVPKQIYNSPCVTGFRDRKLEGRLAVNRSPTSCCFQSNHNEAACSYIKKNWKDTRIFFTFLHINVFCLHFKHFSLFATICDAMYTWAPLWRYASI